MNERHEPRPDFCTPYCTPDDHPAPRVLVTMHLPLDMHCVAMVMKAVADAYPRAVVGENGTIWDRPVVA